MSEGYDLVTKSVASYGITSTPGQKSEAVIAINNALTNEAINTMSQAELNEILKVSNDLYRSSDQTTQATTAFNQINTKIITRTQEFQQQAFQQRTAGFAPIQQGAISQLQVISGNLSDQIQSVAAITDPEVKADIGKSLAYSQQRKRKPISKTAISLQDALKRLGVSQYDVSGEVLSLLNSAAYLTGKGKFPKFSIRTIKANRPSKEASAQAKSVYRYALRMAKNLNAYSNILGNPNKTITDEMIQKKVSLNNVRKNNPINILKKKLKLQNKGITNANAAQQKAISVADNIARGAVARTQAVAQKQTELLNVDPASTTQINAYKQAKTNASKYSKSLTPLDVSAANIQNAIL